MWEQPQPERVCACVCVLVHACALLPWCAVCACMWAGGDVGVGVCVCAAGSVCTLVCVCFGGCGWVLGSTQAWREQAHVGKAGG